MSKKLFAVAALGAGAYFAAPYVFGAGTAAAGTAATGTAAAGTAGASIFPSWLSPAFTLASGAFQSISAAQQGDAMRRAGEADQAAANAQAAVMERNAGQARAQSQRDALEQRRRVMLASSRARAVAAAGGTATTDPGVVDILSDLDAEGEYRFRTALTGGEAEAQGMEYAAAVKRQTGLDALEAGRAQRRSSYLSAGATLAGSFGKTLLDKYR